MKVTLLRNIFAHNNDRHPEIGGQTNTFLVNNLIYNPSQTPLSSIYYADSAHQGASLSVVRGNVLIPGPTTPGHNGYVPREFAEDGEVTLIRVDQTINSSSQIYLEGNYYEKHCPGGTCLNSVSAQWMLARDYPRDWYGINIRAASPPLNLANLPLSSALPADAVEGFLVANAGARPADRDAVDNRLAGEIVTRTGSVPNRTSEKAGAGTGADGFPILASNRRALAVPDNPNAIVDGAGRSRIELWLEEFARDLEPGNAGGGSSSRAPSPPSMIQIQATN
jgi:hypothetical protein